MSCVIQFVYFLIGIPVPCFLPDKSRNKHHNECLGEYRLVAGTKDLTVVTKDGNYKRIMYGLRIKLIPTN